MNRTNPAETKLVICVWHPFTFWRPQPVMPQTIRARWPEMRVLHLPDYDRLPAELLHAQPLGIGLTSVAAGALTFLMSHASSTFRCTYQLNTD